MTLEGSDVLPSVGVGKACRLPLALVSQPSESASGAAMTILTWIIVGLVAGVLASLVMGGTGYGLIGDIIVGIVGAFVGGWIFASLGVSSPWGGLPGTIFIAFIGAVVLLFLLRLIRGARRTV
jgi:uncharacterized membrane protein YeaQ/YmgE (transglycosylase-associated protein family)